MSFFQKSKIELEKILHHSLIQRPPTPFPRPYLYEVATRESFTTHDCIMLRIGVLQYRRTDGPTDGPTDGEAVWGNSWMGDFGGCFEKGCRSRKNEFCCFYFYPPKKDRLTFG